jgi:hypothetical protein
LFTWSLFFDDEVDDFGLADVEVGLGLEDFAHFDAIELLIALCAGTPDGGAARSVEETELDAHGVRDFAHDAAKCVDFTDEMAFGDTADGWVAAHLGDEIEVHGDERRLKAHASGSHGGFATGVTGADHGDVVLFGESHQALFYGENEARAADGGRTGDSVDGVGAAIEGWRILKDGVNANSDGQARSEVVDIDIRDQPDGRMMALGPVHKPIGNGAVGLSDLDCEDLVCVLGSEVVGFGSATGCP